MPKGPIRKVVMLDRDNNIVKEFKNCAVASKETGVPSPTIHSQCVRKSKGRCDFYFIYKKDYELLKKKEDKPILKTKRKEYYVNVLVGLASDKLEDGATYVMNGTRLTYSFEKKALMCGDTIAYSKEKMFEEVEVELPLLLPEERNFLKTLLKAFTNVKGIIKCKDRRQGFEFIRIETDSEEETITLPSYIEGKYYKALQIDRLYTIDELEI